MTDWHPMATAPKGFWINAKSKTGTPLAVIYDEPGFWEDETGDYLGDTSVVEAGLAEWSALPNDWKINDQGTGRFTYPAYTAEQYGIAKGLAFQQYIRARKLEIHNRSRKLAYSDTFAGVNQRKHEQLAEQYPDFPAAYERIQK